MAQRQFYYTGGDLFKGVDQKSKLVSQFTNPEHYSNISNKKSIIQGNKCNPLNTSRYKPFISHSKNEGVSQIYLNKNQSNKQKEQEREWQRPKANSFVNDKIEKISNSAYDYLSFAQRHHKLQEDRNKTNYVQQSTKKLVIEVDYNELKGLKQENRNIKDMFDSLRGDLQLKNALLLNKQKQFQQKITQLTESSRIIQIFQKKNTDLQQHISVIQAKCKQNEENNSVYIRLQHNFRGVVLKCTQLENTIALKDFIIKTASAKNEEELFILKGQASMAKEFQVKISLLTNQNQELNQKIIQLQNNLAFSSQHKERGIDANQFQKLAHQFQRKINQVQEENTKLKNTVGHLQGKVGQLEVQKQAVQNIVNALQQRNSQTQQSVLQDQIDSLRKQLQSQKEQKDKLISKYELQILKQQNLICNERYLKTESLLDFSDEERLQQKLMVAISQIELLRSKLKQKKI